MDHGKYPLTELYVQQDNISKHFEERLKAENCISDENATGITTAFERSTASTTCIYLLYRRLFPWPLWTLLSAHFIMSSGLVVSSLYK